MFEVFVKRCTVKRKVCLQPGECLRDKIKGLQDFVYLCVKEKFIIEVDCFSVKKMMLVRYNLKFHTGCGLTIFHYFQVV